jgi:copper chaperone CopZ
MFRTALVIAALALSPAAFACGSNANCAHCNQAPTTAAVDVDAAAGTKVSLAITGMSCGACSDKIVAALNETAGVNAVTVDHETGRARVAYDEAALSVDALIAAVATAGGFEASLVTDAS